MLSEVESNCFTTESLCPEGTVLQFIDEIQNQDELADAELPMIDLDRLYQNSNPTHPYQAEIQFIDSSVLQNEIVLGEFQQPKIASNGCDCKGLEKIQNKLDYFQKRMRNEIADLRYETIKSIRELTDLVRSHLPNTQPQEQVDISDDLHDKYKAIFPVNDKVVLRSINKQFKADSDFKGYVDLKLDKINGTDATKTARKILNALCTVNCYSQFTWLGTKDKDRFLDMESIIDLVTKILEKRFPKCGAFDIFETVVKQRTKSAGEAVKENVKISKSDGETVNENVQILKSCQDAAAINSSPAIDHLAKASQINNEVDNQLEIESQLFDPNILLNFEEDSI